MNILDTAVSRTPLGEHDGRSGASLERVVLADGARLVVKRSQPGADLVRLLTGDDDGREYRLWRSGALDRLPPGVGHAILDGWRDGSGDVLVMRDLGGAVFGWNDVLSGADVDRLLTAVVALHRTPVAATVCPLLTPLAARIGFFGPARMRPLSDRFPLARAVLTGWDRFAGLVDRDVADAVLALLADPAPLVEALADRPCGLIHGDLWPVNVAVTGNAVVLLDWGLAGWSPPALDVASFLAGAGAANLAISRDEVLDRYRSTGGRDHDETGLRLALLNGLVDFGWNKALDAATAPDAGERRRHRADLDWWVGHARQTLHAGGLS